MNHFHFEVTQYLTSALSATTLLNQYYNNGALHDGWCDECGTISIQNEPQRQLLKKALKGVMTIYIELTWLYIGFENGTFIGYKRVKNNTGDEKLQLWTCYPPNDYAGCSGAGFYDSDVEPLIEPTIQDDIKRGDKPTSRVWYTDAVDSSLSIDEVFLFIYFFFFFSH